MCGIAGFVGPDPAAHSVSRVEALLAAQAHRGPDDGGLLVFDPRPDVSRYLDRDGVATPFRVSHAPGPGRSGSASAVLGSRRLAILDRSAGGRQPMATEDGRYVIVANGEIYNYLELRGELEAAGHRFRSRSDTEVLLAAWARWGADCLGRLVGMFAFVVLDTLERRLFLARDPFGIKPLHYTARGGSLVFSSEISPLLDWPGISRRAAPQPLLDYLESGVVDLEDETSFADVAALPPACCAEVSLEEPGLVRPRRYWTPDLDRVLEISFEEAAARLRELFLESVRLHLRSDVPVGVLLSGGTDSSSVAMAMREVGGASLDIHTFSYIGGQGAASEERWIDIVNAAAGAVPHKLEMQPGELAADLEGLVRTQEEPFGSIAIYAQARLFREARAAGVPVVLSGTGSDELLAGYEWFWPARVAECLGRADLPAAAGLLASATRAKSRLAVAPRLLASAALLGSPRLSGLAARLRRPKPWIASGWCASRGLRRKRWPVTGRRLFADRIWHRLAVGIPDLLRFEDRGGMASSIEARVPFLTRELVEFALALPSAYLIGPRGETKHVLKAAMRGIVPAEILDRKDKVAFAVPVDSWPHSVPGFTSLLESLAGIPAVDMRALDAPLAALRAGRPLSAPMVYPVWRLAGLAAWARHLEVRFD